jgi:multiple sugar transport system ATP-binding protein
MSVEDNIGFALKLAHVPKKEIQSRVSEAAKMLDLEEYLHRKPKALSGGQRQRVAMGRAIVRRPQVFLLDEPLSNLDAKLRVQTRTQIASLQRRLGVTTVYVTHDQVEAMTMGDRVAVLDRGLLKQVDSPHRLFTHPANVFVAGFIGSPAMNLHEAAVEDGHALFAGSRVPIPRVDAGSVVLGFRPESLVMATNGDGFEVTVQAVEELGSDAYVHGTFGAEEQVVDSPDVIARIDPNGVPGRGSRIKLRIKPDTLHLFDPKTGDRIET